jgi:RNA-directed DNA polymerase
VYADTVEGPQGAGISSLLANIFPDYVLDLWVEQWKRRYATGQVRLVRYADDYLLLFRRRQDAETMMAALAGRPAKFGLHLHEDKTRLIEFGRFAEENRRRKGRARPEVFVFLGFTHCCGKTTDGRFLLCQKTQRKRMIRKMKELRQKMRRRMHQWLRDQHKWLTAVLRGHYAAYFGVPGNSTCLGGFRLQVMKAWRRVLLRRSQRPKLSWERFNAILKVFPIPIGHVLDWHHQMA